jgi:glycosyltransferase involved in cell wall biosynthesis
MHCEWLTQLDRRLVDQRLAKADVIVGVSDFITDRIREAFPRHASRCITIHNGADLVPASRRNRSGPVRLLTVGRISPEKGLHVLVDAFARLAQQHDDVELKVVGKEGLPPQEMLLNLDETPRVRKLAPHFRGGYLQHLRERLPERSRSRVKFQGWAEHEELPAEYEDADVFVFPSVWDEPFGIPVAEAMAAGLPVVASRVGGIPEIVADGETGMLVEPDDASALAAALEQLVNDAGLRARLGEAGRLRAAERFSWDRAAAAYRALFAGRG